MHVLWCTKAASGLGREAALRASLYRDSTSSQFHGLASCARYLEAGLQDLHREQVGSPTPANAESPILSVPRALFGKNTLPRFCIVPLHMSTPARLVQLTLKCSADRQQRQLRLSPQTITYPD